MKFKEYLLEQKLDLNESIIDNAINTITSKAFKFAPDKLALKLLKSAISSLFVNSTKKHGIEKVKKVVKPKLDDIQRHVKNLKPSISRDLKKFIDDKSKEIEKEANWEKIQKKYKDPKYGDDLIKQMEKDHVKLKTDVEKLKQA